MGWATNKASVVTVLTANSYKEIKSGRVLGDNQGKSEENKNYTLRPQEMETEFATSKALLRSDYAVLRVAYRCRTNADCDSNYDLWRTLLEALKDTQLVDFTP